MVCMEVVEGKMGLDYLKGQLGSLDCGHFPVVSVIIPSFNEECGLEDVLKRTHRVFSEIGLSYEIIVVNDGSTDGTSKVVLENRAVLVENSRNMGKGFSMRRGLRYARGEFIVFMDADGEHRPEDIPLLLYPFVRDEKLSVVMGSRFYNGSGEVGSRLHLFGNKIFNLMIFLLTGRHVTDSQSGFRAFRRSVFEDISIDSSSFAVETEVLLKVLNNGFSFKEVPITYVRRVHGVRKLRSFRDGWKIFKAIIKYSIVSRG